MNTAITTPRLHLRALEQKDARGIVELLDDLEVARMVSGVPHPYELTDALAFLERERAGRAAGTAFVRAIDRKGELTGLIGLTDIEQGEAGKTALLGYWLGRPHWSNGYATEAGLALLHFAFDEMGLARVRSGHFKDNPTSGRVLAKLGFKYVGEGPRACRARGQDVPHVDVALTAHEWQEFAARGAGPARTL